MTPSFPPAPLFSVQAENHLADSPPPTFPEHYARNLGRMKPQKVKPTCLGQVGVQSGPHRVEGTLYRREGVIDPDRYEKGSWEEWSAPSMVRDDLRGLPEPWEQRHLYSFHQILG